MEKTRGKTNLTGNKGEGGNLNPSKKENHGGRGLDGRGGGGVISVTQGFKGGGKKRVWKS